MQSKLIHKHDIAIEFIDVSIQLYEDRKYCSSLHLAAAAEQIFHDTLKDKKIETAKEKSARLAQGLSQFYKVDRPSRASIEKVMDYPKNAIKHVEKNGDYIYEVRLRPQLDSFRMIKRAIKNGRQAEVNLGQKSNYFMSKNELDIHNA